MSRELFDAYLHARILTRATGARLDAIGATCGVERLSDWGEPRLDVDYRIRIADKLRVVERIRIADKLGMVERETPELGRDGGDRREWSGAHLLAYCELVPCVAHDRLAEIHGKHTDWLATTGRSAALAAAWSLYPARYEPRDDARAEELARQRLDGMGRGLASMCGFRTGSDWRFP